MTGVAGGKSGGDGAAFRLLLPVRRRHCFLPFWRMTVIPNVAIAK